MATPSFVVALLLRRCVAVAVTVVAAIFATFGGGSVIVVLVICGLRMIEARGKFGALERIRTRTRRATFPFGCLDLYVLVCFSVQVENERS